MFRFIKRVRLAVWAHDIRGLGWYVKHPRVAWRDRRGIAASVLDTIEEIVPCVSRVTGKLLQP